MVSMMTYLFSARGFGHPVFLKPHFGHPVMKILAKTLGTTAGKCNFKKDKTVHRTKDNSYFPFPPFCLKLSLNGLGNQDLNLCNHSYVQEQKAIQLVVRNKNNR